MPVTHAQTWASYSALYRFGRLSDLSWMPTCVNHRGDGEQIIEWY